MSEIAPTSGPRAGPQPLPENAAAYAPSREPAPAASAVRYQLLGEDGSAMDGPLGLPDAELLRLYEWMVRVRVLDARMLLLHRQGKVAFYVPSLGEEAAQIGTASALLPQDWVFPAYREQGVLLYRGLPLRTLVAQCLGTAGDLLKGRQMPNHFGSAAHRFAVASSPVGTQLPHAVGAAWACRLRGEDAVAVTYFGDGATSTGDFHAALNLAAVQRLPVVFCCKNNGWAISHRVSEQTRGLPLARKADAYGMPGFRVDGNDLPATRAAMEHALAHARSGHGPVLLELLTQRLGPHSTADDPARYRTAEELAVWEARDPLLRCRRYLAARGLLEESGEQQLWRTMEAELARALLDAEAEGPPELATMFQDVYACQPRHLSEQYREALEAAAHRAAAGP
jgi:pyruvate dehydrogenase E1 component alpha subunit